MSPYVSFGTISIMQIQTPFTQFVHPKMILAAAVFPRQPEVLADGHRSAAGSRRPAAATFTDRAVLNLLNASDEATLLRLIPLRGTQSRSAEKAARRRSGQSASPFGNCAVGRVTPCAPSGGHLTCEPLITLAAGRGLPALPSRSAVRRGIFRSLRTANVAPDGA